MPRKSSKSTTNGTFALHLTASSEFIVKIEAYARTRQCSISKILRDGANILMNDQHDLFTTTELPGKWPWKGKA